MQAATILAMCPRAAPTTARVLIADDLPQILEALQLLLKRSGFSTEAVTHPACVFRALEAGSFDAVLWRVREETNGWDCRAIAYASAAQHEEI